MNAGQHGDPGDEGQGRDHDDAETWTGSPEDDGFGYFGTGAERGLDGVGRGFLAVCLGLL